MRTVAVLFARSDSVYKTLPGCDVFDEQRDAMTWLGGAPVVAHPPCRLWGNLSQFSKADLAEAELARWAVKMVRLWGGVLEHPVTSRLWRDQRLAAPGTIDDHGGRTITIEQWHWGHRAQKRTRLYIVGVRYPDLPPQPRRAGVITHVVNTPHRKGKHPGWRPHITKAEREHTPPALAEWLLNLARSTTAVRAAA